MSEQVGWRGFIKSLRTEAPNYATVLPQLPRLLHRYLSEIDSDRYNDLQLKILEQQHRYNTLLTLLLLVLLCIFAWEVIRFYIA